MTDAQLVALLQWALPRMGMCWRGFRKPRRQVRRRVAERMAELGIPDVGAYRARLESNEDEWAALDRLCRVTISRFYRDRRVWEQLGAEVLPDLVGRARRRGARTFRAWSAGCASGEEAFTLVLLFRFVVAHEGLEVSVLGTDIDDAVLERAREACYGAASLRELPSEWRRGAFEADACGWRLDEADRSRVRFERMDIRRDSPTEPFDVVLCRNLAFTYYDDPLRRRVARRLADRLVDGGALVIGGSEALPDGISDLQPWDRVRAVFRRSG